MAKKKFDIPLGLGMALAQNDKAMERYASLSDEEKQKLIKNAHGVNSKAEMQSFVQKLAEDNTPGTTIG